MRFGLNFPYSDRALSSSTWRQIERANPEQITLTSFAGEDTIARICDNYPDAAIVVRPRTGPQNQPWPSDILDYRSWPTERSLRDCLRDLVGRGMQVRVVMGNEPRLEWAPPWPGDAENREAARQYSAWYLNERANVKAAFPGVPVAPAPHDQGDDHATAIWLDIMDGFECYSAEHADFLADHCYYASKDFDDESWGGRWRMLRRRYPHLGPIWNLETNDCGDYSDGDTAERASRLRAYIERCRAVSPDDLACVSLFTIKGAPGDNDKPAWWFLTTRMLDAANEARSVAVTVDPPVIGSISEPSVEEPKQEPLPEEPAMPERPLGIDVASYQGYPDWDAVRASGVQFGITKLTEDNDAAGYVNPTFAHNWEGMRQAGIIRGVYHFARPSAWDAVAEADYFLRTFEARAELLTGDLIALDIEAGQGDLGQWCLDWLRRVESVVGFKPLVYTGAWFAGPHNFAAYPELGEYGLWFAAYQSQMPAPVAPWDTIAIWQYSSTGRVDGIAGDVDMNVFNGPIERLPLYGYQPAPVPEPVPEPEPTYAVGAGILAAMAVAGDAPATDEAFYPHNQFSEAYGVSGSRYVYIASLGRTYRYAPAA